MDIVRYDPSWWAKLRGFVERHWQAGHPVTDRRFFEWQYCGYGPHCDGLPWVFLAVEGDALAGFIGTIPGRFRFPSGDGPRKGPGSFLAMWMIEPKYRSTGLGAHLLDAAHREAHACAVLGANELAAGIFRRMGYREIRALTRWVAPLEAGYRDLLVDAGAAGAAEAVAAWRKSLPQAEPASPCAIGDFDLAGLWGKGGTVFGLDRTEEFYRWRYQDSPGFHYQALRAAGGAAIVRVETPEIEKERPVLRIIELLPGTADTVIGGAVDHGLVPAVLAWGRGQGCRAADFQASGGCFEPTLTMAGMRIRAPERPETMLAELLRPYRPAAVPINALYRAEAGASREWCFLKSDGDMDRPNRVLDVLGTVGGRAGRGLKVKESDHELHEKEARR